MANVDLYSAIITKVSNALDTLVSGEKPGFQTLFTGLVVLLCAEVVRQRVPDHGAVHSECSAFNSGQSMSGDHHQLLCGWPETLPADNISDRCATVHEVLRSLAMCRMTLQVQQHNHNRVYGPGNVSKKCAQVIVEVSWLQYPAAYLTAVEWILHRESKNKTVRLSRKFVTKPYTNTPPHPKRVATLHCEISVFKKSPFLRSKRSKLLCKT